MWVTVSSPERSPRAVRLQVGTYLIGRGANCHVTTDDPHVSTRHAQLDVLEEGAWLSDLQSTNGTFVSGRRLSTGVWLAFPSEFHIGQTTVSLTADQPTVPSAHPSTGLGATPPTDTPATPTDRSHVAEDGSATGGPVVAAHRKEQDRPWYQRGRSMIVAAGGVAAAVLAMLGLWDRVFPADVMDVATITSAEVTRQMPLSEFADTASGTDVSLTPASAAIVPDFDVRAQIPQIRLMFAPAGTFHTDTETPTDDETPTDSGTPTPTDSGTPTPTDSGTPTPTDDKTPTDAETPDTRFEWWPPPDNYVKLVLADLKKDFVSINLSVALSLMSDPTDPDDPDGDPLPADEVATRLAKALQALESEDSGGKLEDNNGKKDPLGWVVAVNMEARGLEGVPLLLTWSLDGLNVPVSWAADSVAYRLTPSTAHDTGSVEVWVPKLERPGEYNVNLKLALESDGTVIFQSKSVELANR